MGSKRRKCSICGSMYDYCPHCAEYKGLPTWKSIYCSDECKDIYGIVNKFAFNHISKDGAKEELDKFNLLKIKNVEIKKVVDDIYFIPEVVPETTEEDAIVKTTSRKRKKKTVEPVTEDVLVENTEIIDE